jgi:hypothetical protein
LVNKEYHNIFKLNEEGYDLVFRWSDKTYGFNSRDYSDDLLHINGDEKPRFQDFSFYQLLFIKKRPKGFEGTIRMKMYDDPILVPKNYFYTNGDCHKLLSDEELLCNDTRTKKRKV